jgi:hypothetical protein
MMPTIRSAPRNGGPSASDEALLDEFVATALAEDVEPSSEPGLERTSDEPKSAPTPAAVDHVDAFLQCTAAYLNTRPDRQLLLERLRVMTSAAPAEKQPGDPAAGSKAE